MQLGLYIKSIFDFHLLSYIASCLSFSFMTPNRNKDGKKLHSGLCIVSLQPSNFDTHAEVLCWSNWHICLIIIIHNAQSPIWISSDSVVTQITHIYTVKCGIIILCLALHPLGNTGFIGFWIFFHYLFIV